MSLTEMEIENIVNKTLDDLKQFYSGPVHQNDLVNRLKESEFNKSIEVQKQVFLNFAKTLRDNHDLHSAYNLEKLPKGTVWVPMKKLVTAVRVNELKQVKVIRRKGKYDVKQLRQTHFGKRIFEDLPDLGGRWMLSKDDYRKVELQCRKLNLELPEVIEPTTTEKFFGDDDE